MSICIINANVKTMAGKDYEKGEIRIEDGIITQIGESVDQTGADIVDAKGQLVLPGFIDAHCHIGMWEDGIGHEGADGNEMTDPVTPQLRAIDAINQADPCFAEAREHGITTAVTGPGSANVIGGQFVALKTYGRTVDEMMIQAPVALKLAFGENPKRVYQEQKKTPSTRMATASMLRQTLISAQEYARKMKEKDKKPDRDLKMEVMVDVLEKRLPVKIHVHRADDIITAIRICKEFDLRYTLEHCTEGYMIADILCENGITPIIGPLICERCKIELKNLTMRAPGILENAGVKFAIMTDHPVIPIQYLSVSVILAVREGLSRETALKAITIHAAEIVGIADRVGSLEVGKDADLQFYNGDPLDVMNKPTQVWIGGKEVFNSKS